MSRIALTFEEFVSLVMRLGNHTRADVTNEVLKWARERKISFRR